MNSFDYDNDNGCFTCRTNKYIVKYPGSNSLVCTECLNSIKMAEQKCNNHFCKYCKTNEYIINDNSSGSVICTKCGIQLDSRIISQEKDWNNYEDGVDKSRVSYIDVMNPYATPGTYIAPGTWITSGLNPDGSKRKMDLGKMHARIVYTSKQRSYDSVAKEFDKMDEEFPKNITMTAKRYWGKIMDGNIHRGSIRKGIIASCILYACYENKCSRTRNDIASLMRIDRDCIIKGEPLFLDMTKGTEIEYVSKLSSSTEEMFYRYIYKFGIKDINFKHEKMCKEFYEKYEKYFVNMKPESVIGGIICYILKEKEKMKKPTKKSICEIVGISDPTINKSLKKIKEIIKKENN